MNPAHSKRPSRISEAAGLMLLLLGLLFWLSLVSYNPEDPSWNTAADHSGAHNLIGVAGAYSADLALQAFGAFGFLVPVLMILVAWHWVRGRTLRLPLLRSLGWLLFLLSGAMAVGIRPQLRIFNGAIPAAGVLGLVVGDYAARLFNITGAILISAAGTLLALYLCTSFSLEHLSGLAAIPRRLLAPLTARFHREPKEPSATRDRLRRLRDQGEEAAPIPEEPPIVVHEQQPAYIEPVVPEPPAPTYAPVYSEPPWEPDPEPPAPSAAPEPAPQPVAVATAEIPIQSLEATPEPPREAEIIGLPAPEPARHYEPPRRQTVTEFHLPSTALLNEPPARSGYDEQELKDVASRIKSKFEEFNVFGSVVQINPGPVVTTFEYKPDAGIKYNRITNLDEDLCLGLRAESIIIERIPGKPTVGIEVPNSKRELISLRQILESEEFANAPSRLSIALGKDANGRIKAASLESMPHLLIAGSTGSGKSVMLNSLIMSILYKSTPDEVRMILVDPKRLEMGLYEGIPHLLTPVITDAKKATNALRNAVLEMERRLRLLASQGVRNIDQFNKKVGQLQRDQMALFEQNPELAEELRPLPYILVLIDELADLMIVEGHNVEHSITRLAQMARAVGMHLVVATQRPSVDVITGLIKANFPARMSFRVATRVDSRTILDVMGAEHLLGKGDMLFLPPGASRLVRVHGAFVTETEINRVVDFWKEQASPDYDQSYLVAPIDEDEGASETPVDQDEDPLYREAVRVVLEVGKASTSTLQRRLRLGYGRAARILDMMQRDGIIGPPDGSKPREVLKRPDWIDEIDNERMD